MIVPLLRPSSVLFACTMNRVRSPMAAALMKNRVGARVFVDSCGVLHTRGERKSDGEGEDEDDGAQGEVEALVREVLSELSVSIPTRRPKRFAEVSPDQFDLIIGLTEEACEAAAAAVRGCAVDLEVWETLDPALEDGSRLQRLEAYRQLRRALSEKIALRFPV